MRCRPPWQVPLAALLAELRTTPAGLTDAEARQRLAAYGPNDALSRRRRPLWRQVLDRFANPLILILLFAGGLSAWTGEVTSFLIITGIILLKPYPSRSWCPATSCDLQPATSFQPTAAFWLRRTSS